MTVRALIVDDDAAPLAVDAHCVRAVIALPELTPVPTAPPGVLGLANVRGDIVVVLDTGLLLAGAALDRAPFVVVVDSAVGPAGLAVPVMPVAAEVDDDAVVDVSRLVQDAR